MFNVGTLVWAQLRGYCYWPGQIAPYPEGKARAGYYYIFFYGSHDYGWVPKSKVCIYAENRSKFLVKRRSQPFQIAVREIERIAIVEMGENDYYEEIGENEILRQQCEKMYPKIRFRKCSVALHRVKLHSHSGSEVSYADSTMSTAKDVSATDQVIRKKFQDDFPDIKFQNCSVILDRIKVDNHSKTDSEVDSDGADDQVASEDNASEDNASGDNASGDNASGDNASEEEEASLEDNLEFDDDAIESEDIVSAHNLITTESHIESDDDVMTAEEAAIRDQLISDGDMYDDETAASDDSFLSEDSTSIDEATFNVNCLVSSDSSIFADDDSLTSAEAALVAEAVIAAGHLYSAEDSMALVDTIIMAKHLKAAEASMSAAEAASSSDCISCTSMPSTSHHIVNVSQDTNTVDMCSIMTQRVKVQDNADDYFSSDIIGIESDHKLEEIELQTSLASTLQEFVLTSSACPQASMSDLLNSAEAPSLGIEEIDICPDLSSSNSCMEIELQAKFGYQLQNQPK